MARNLWIGISEQSIYHRRTAVGFMVRALGRLGVTVPEGRFRVGGVPFSYLRNLRFQGLRTRIKALVQGVCCGHRTQPRR